jgi:hypothetical protein
VLQALFLNNLMKWMSQKIECAQQHQTDREQTEAGTVGGVNAVASFEEYDINMETIMEFKVNIINLLTGHDVYVRTRLALFKWVFSELLA